MVTTPKFLDVEASSLGKKSYPIEIAWSDNFGSIESYLINPYCVSHWDDWSFSSQQIHGISRKQCREEGVSPSFICDRMSESIQLGEAIFADGGAFDTNWINVVFAEGSDLGHPEFQVLHSDLVMLPHLQKIESDTRKCWRIYEGLKTEARKSVGGRHRAEVDVEYLIELYRLCVSMAGI